MTTVNDKQSCVKAIAEFARTYRGEKVLTPREIYQSTRYASFYSQIIIEDIESVIVQDLELINDWLKFSEDKRWTPAWAFWKSGERWTVRFIEPDGKPSKTLEFEDGSRACAEMVRNEMEQFRCRA